MANDAIPFTIRFSAVEDFLNCSVCLCTMTRTHTTPCGHRYCEKCIKEWVDRHKSCPCCNARVRGDQLVKDHQFDDLIRAIDAEKTASEASYFDSLINSATETASSMETGDEDASRAVLSPMETVLKQHLKESLIAHEKYYQDLIKQGERRRAEISAEYQRSKDNLEAMQLSLQAMAEKEEELRQQRDEALETVNANLRKTSACVSEAYDKYLREHIPSLTILPVRVDIVLLSKNVTLRDIDIKAQDSMADIKAEICRAMQGQGDRVLGFADDVQFFAFGPLAKRTPYEMLDIVRNMVQHGASHADIHDITTHARPVMQCSMKAGSVIAVYGTVQYESDLPKQCFADTFTPGQGHKMDYFSCKQCSFNWICRPCMEACHRDHEVVPYIIGHQPTWGCCYCPKKKTCTLMMTQL